MLLLEKKVYITPDEDINSLELAHLILYPETVIAIYVGINDAVQ